MNSNITFKVKSYFGTGTSSYWISPEITVNITSFVTCNLFHTEASKEIYQRDYIAGTGSWVTLYGFETESLFTIPDSRCNISYSIVNPSNQSEEAFERL